MVQKPPANAGNTSSIPAPGRSRSHIALSNRITWAKSPCSATREPMQWESYTQQERVVPCLLQIQKAHMQQRPSAAQNCCCSVAHSCPTLCHPVDCSTPGFPVLHHLLELVQTHVHWVGDAIQPSHPLSSPSPPAFNLYQHQGLFQWVSSWYQVAKVLELQHQSFQWIFRTLKSLLQYHISKASVLQRLAFFMVQFSHPYMTTGKTIALTIETFVGRVMSLFF